MKRILKISAIVFGILFVVGGIYVFRVDSDKTIEATIINHGPVRMDNVIVYVTGNQYSIGIIDVNSKGTALVVPRSDSHIEISYSSQGKPSRLVVDCYFERGYSGRISVEVSNNSITKVTSNIETSRY